MIRYSLLGGLVVGLFVLLLSTFTPQTTQPTIEPVNAKSTAYYVEQVEGGTLFLHREGDTLVLDLEDYFQYDLDVHATNTVIIYTDRQENIVDMEVLD